jgi:anti-sigma B factor antagonist
VRSGIAVTPTPEEEQAYTVDHDPVEGALLVAASGELDLAAAPRLATVLSMATQSAEPCVVLDLSEVDFIDSTALGAIMHASTEAEATGKRMLVVALDGPVRSLLEITNLTGRFRVYPSRDDALAALTA